MGGTCLNNGCIPSKMLIHPADIIRSIQEAGAVGVHARIEKIDFPLIMNRMHKVVDEGRAQMEATIRSRENLTHYPERAEFIDEYVLKVGSRTLTAPNSSSPAALGLVFLPSQAWKNRDISITYHFSI